MGRTKEDRAEEYRAAYCRHRYENPNKNYCPSLGPSLRAEALLPSSESGFRLRVGPLGSRAVILTPVFCVDCLLKGFQRRPEESDRNGIRHGEALPGGCQDLSDPRAAWDGEIQNHRWPPVPPADRGRDAGVGAVAEGTVPLSSN